MWRDDDAMGRCFARFVGRRDWRATRTVEAINFIAEFRLALSKGFRCKAGVGSLTKCDGRHIC
jgi:hypothetical protein